MKIDEDSNYSPEQLSLSKLCRTLGHPARVALMESIARVSNCVEDKVIQLEQVGFLTMVKHLKSLHSAGLVKGNITSLKDLSYCVNWEKMDEFKSMFDALYNEMNAHRNCDSTNIGKCTK